jgi:hypothetical protein
VKIVKKSDNLGLNLPEGTDKVDFQTFFTDNFKTIDTSLADKTKYEVTITSQGAHSISETGYDSFDSTNAIKGAIAFVKTLGGGKVKIPSGTFLVSSTISVPAGVFIEGVSANIWSGASILCPITAGMTCLNFETVTNGARLKDFIIQPRSTDPAYQNCTGIEVNGSEYVDIERVNARYCNIGWDLSAATRPLYLVNFTDISAEYNKAQGILVRSTGNFKNGITIKIRSLTNNNVGIECQDGSGSTLLGGTTEIGLNTEEGIKITGGVWTLKGYMWIENNDKGGTTPKSSGIYISSNAKVYITDDIYCVDNIECPNPNSLVNNTRAMSATTTPPRKKMPADYSFRFSFDETDSATFYSDNNSKTLSKLVGTAPAKDSSSPYGHAVSGGDGVYTLTKELNHDWTLLLLTKMTGTPDNQYFIKFRNDANNDNFYLQKNYAGGNSNAQAGFSFYSDNSGGYLGNMYSFDGFLISNYVWLIMGYDATNKKINLYSSSGNLIKSFTFDFTNYTGGLPWLMAFANMGIDECVMYDRILSAPEIQAITNLEFVPKKTRIYQPSVPTTLTPVPFQEVINSSITAAKNIARWVYDSSSGWSAVGSGYGTTALRPTLGANDKGIPTTIPH